MGELIESSGEELTDEELIKLEEAVAAETETGSGRNTQGTRMFGNEQGVVSLP